VGTLTSVDGNDKSFVNNLNFDISFSISYSTFLQNK
jgi:hypothetical protein